MKTKAATTQVAPKFEWFTPEESAHFLHGDCDCQINIFGIVISVCPLGKEDGYIVGKLSPYWGT